MTQSVLLFLGTLGSIFSLGVVFRSKIERWTRVLITFVGSLCWAIVGMGSFDVVVGVTDSGTVVSEPIVPLAYLGIAISIVVGLFVIYDIYVGLVEEAELSGRATLMGGRW